MWWVGLRVRNRVSMILKQWLEVWPEGWRVRFMDLIMNGISMVFMIQVGFLAWVPISTMKFGYVRLGLLRVSLVVVFMMHIGFRTWMEFIMRLRTVMNLIMGLWTMMNFIMGFRGFIVRFWSRMNFIVGLWLLIKGFMDLIVGFWGIIMRFRSLVVRRGGIIVRLGGIIVRGRLWTWMNFIVRFWLFIMWLRCVIMRFWTRMYLIVRFWSLVMRLWTRMHYFIMRFLGLIMVILWLVWFWGMILWFMMLQRFDVNHIRLTRCEMLLMFQFMPIHNFRGWRGWGWMVWNFAGMNNMGQICLMGVENWCC